MNTFFLICVVSMAVLTVHAHRQGGWGHRGRGSSSEEDHHGGWGAPSKGCQRDVNRTREAENKKLTLEFVHKILEQKDVSQLDRLVCADKYIQHNPYVKDGLQGVKDFFSTLPGYINKVQETLPITLLSAEGDLTYVGYRTTNLNTGASGAIIDVFRFCDNPKQGRCICEHWDLLQAVPAGAVTDHPLFN